MSERPKALRLFIGVRVSLATVRALDDAVQTMRRSSPGDRAPRWVSPASYHITLKFLGWARPEVGFALRDRIAGAIAGQRAFELETRGLGAFPTPERARVVWAGVDPAGGARLTELAGRVERAAEELGFAREQRPFHAHVTLARLRDPADIRTLLGSCPEQAFRVSWVDSAVLFESHMRSTGSEYEEKARWPLEADSKPSRRHTGPVEPEAELADDLPLDEGPSDSGEDPGTEGAPEGAGAEREEHEDDGDQY
ncbi:MAG TPA: RNA 2',3'-cyclic phosphodiesterase [Candidatus Acidoferrum sp.]|nr:RNA 2',3'-cyclic phosphodiesterase [Candidatus Acidoferrum sp.]